MAEGENIEMAIEVIGAADDESLAQNFRDYLMGEIDGTSKVSKLMNQIGTLSGGTANYHLVLFW